MTKLQELALATLPLPVEFVEEIYSGGNLVSGIRLQHLCESHERLRAELEGAEMLLAEKEVAEMRERKRLEETLAKLQSAQSIAAASGSDTFITMNTDSDESRPQKKREAE